MTAPRYDAAHRRARKAFLGRLQDGDPCARCGRPMYRANARWLDLDHIDGSPDQYRGLTHRACNRRSGAVKGNKARGAARHGIANPVRTTWQSRIW